MSNLSGGMAICPFYDRETSLSIGCSIDISSPQDFDISLKFKDISNKCSFQKRYCLTYTYAACPVAKVLLARFAGSAVD